MGSSSQAGTGWTYLQLIGSSVVDCQALTWPHVLSWPHLADLHCLLLAFKGDTPPSLLFNTSYCWCELGQKLGYNKKCWFGETLHEISSCCAQCFDLSLFCENWKTAYGVRQHVTISTKKPNQNIVHNVEKSFLLHRNGNKLFLGMLPKKSYCIHQPLLILLLFPLLRVRNWTWLTMHNTVFFLQLKS